MNGLHLIGDLSGCRCDPQLLLDGKRFEEVCVGMVQAAGLAVMDARRLEDIGQRPPNLMRVRLDMAAVDANIIDELKKLFAGKPGSCSIAFDLISSEGAIATLQADQRVRPDQDLVQAVRKLCGEDAVELVARN